MNTTYAQKQSSAQKKKVPTASSVLDASSQSEALQRKADMANNAAQREEAPRPNNTGMPDNLKSGIESLSGFSMDDVRVHYNSSKPATVQALAYTQGTDIHVAPGQEKHLPHEAWHVAQQMADRVSPTTNINGMPVNDNAGLEHEADVMGEKASTLQRKYNTNLKNNNIPHNIVQGKKGRHRRFEKKREINKQRHSQEEIQEKITRLWMNDPINDIDLRYATEAYQNVRINGWCDGWSYVLSVEDEDKLVAVWAYIDDMLDGVNMERNRSIEFDACNFARKAYRYYCSSEEERERKEIWKNDKESTLSLVYIMSEIKKMPKGRTLRLTSPDHDVAVKYSEDGYVVSETELYGIQRVNKLEYVKEILQEWKNYTEKEHMPFFNQMMIV